MQFVGVYDIFGVMEYDCFGCYVVLYIMVLQCMLQGIQVICFGCWFVVWIDYEVDVGIVDCYCVCCLDCCVVVGIEFDIDVVVVVIELCECG